MLKNKMNEKEKITKLFQDFEKKFGFETYEGLKTYLFTLYRKIEDLEISRANWRTKYEELKNENKRIS